MLTTPALLALLLRAFNCPDRATSCPGYVDGNLRALCADYADRADALPGFVAAFDAIISDSVAIYG
tara:strand:+ start:59 stop:256 length:198 start_codon:yes stop_codon:yes gene_type:complete